MSDEQVRRIKADELTPDIRNANRGTERGRYALETSLREYGAGRSIVIDKAGRIIAGNKTLETAAEMGLDDVLVVQTDGRQIVAVQRMDLDLAQDDKARMLAYADNRVGQLDLDFDPAMIAEDIAAGLDLDLFWQDFELDEILEGLDADNGESDSKAPTQEEARKTLAERFLVPPFSVLDARQGYWQSRKSAWIALGIQSEIGRGLVNDAPGGSLLPAATLGDDGKTVRGDGTGKRINGKLPAAIGGQPLPLDRMKNGKSPARTFGQDLMRGEHTVGENRLTWVAGTRSRDEMDETSRKILAAGRKAHGSTPPHGPTVVRAADGTLDYKESSGTSIFDPVLCELAYTWFCAPNATVLDPFAGGSVRGIVAAYLGRKYTGVDLRAEQIAANAEQAASIVPNNLPQWIVGDSAKDLPDGEFDFVFSCPPYYDLEVYSDVDGDISNLGEYDEFLEVYRRIVAESVARLKQDRFACFVVGDIRGKDGNYRNFVSDTIAAFQDAGAMLYNEAILVTAVGSLPIRAGKQFESGRKLGKTHQNVLVFCKGDAKKATQECGSVYVADLYGSD